MNSVAYDHQPGRAVEEGSDGPGRSSAQPPAPPSGYNPAQQRVIDQIGASAVSRPRFERGLGDELRRDLEAGTETLLETIDSDDFPSDDLYLSKFRLNGVLGCERKFLADLDAPFAWSPPTARGTVVHKAVEMSVNWRGETNPAQLVDAAMERLTGSDRSLGDYLRGCSEAERAELRAAASVSVAQFAECFPPLQKQWKPVTESAIRVELHGGRIVLLGKPDLTLGQPEAATANKVIIDFKTGGEHRSHREDLRFYALVEAVRILPPRQVATYYLDQARLSHEEVTLDLLHSAVRRVVDGARRCVQVVSRQREPGVTPGPACRWCPVQPDCAEGTAHLRDAYDADPEAW